MGSPLAPVLANFFMGHGQNKKWNITKNSGMKTFRGLHHPTIEHYVDIFSVFNNSFEIKEFFNYINSRHPNIKFTMEIEDNKIIPF